MPGRSIGRHVSRMIATRPPLEVRDAGPKGRGVFALRAFSPGELIETCPVIVIPQRDLKMIDATSLFAYYFGWSDGGAIAAGGGSFYNHSDEPNAQYERHHDRQTIVFLAVSAIKPDEEITIRYSTGGAETKLWFEPL